MQTLQEALYIYDDAYFGINFGCVSFVVHENLFQVS